MFSCRHDAANLFNFDTELSILNRPSLEETFFLKMSNEKYVFCCTFQFVICKGM